jgi:hypothetical protein
MVPAHSDASAGRLAGIKKPARPRTRERLTIGNALLPLANGRALSCGPSDHAGLVFGKTAGVVLHHARARILCKQHAGSFNAKLDSQSDREENAGGD